MKTNQVIKRDLPISGLAGTIYNETSIRQRTEDEYFNATDLLKAYNEATGSKKKMNNFLRNESTETFSRTIERHQNSKDANSGVLQLTDNQEDEKDAESRLLIETEDGRTGIQKKAYEKKRGRYGGTWMHPYLFLDFAMWLSPEFKYQAIKWIYDNLIEFRDQSGDHYKEMCKAIKEHYVEEFGKEPDIEIYKKEAKKIKKLVGLAEGKNWNKAKEEQLKLRDRLQKANTKAHLQGYMKNKRLKYLQRVKESLELEQYEPQL